MCGRGTPCNGAVVVVAECLFCARPRSCASRGAAAYNCSWPASDVETGGLEFYRRVFSLFALQCWCALLRRQHGRG